MGYSLSWLAVRGKPPQAVRDELGFRLTGKREEIPESAISAVEMPNGWYLIVADHQEHVGSDAALQRLSSGGCELVTCFVEEHVMVSQATGWSDGQMKWSVTHDAQKDRKHLEVQGEPPSEFGAIRESLFAKVEPKTCDYIFDIPVETSRGVTIYRYDRYVPGLSGKVFEVLACDAAPHSFERPPKRPSFFRIFFGA